MEELKISLGFPHMMIDLETLSTKPAAAILSIGAVPFSLESVYHSPLHILLDVKAQRGRHIEPSTVLWWMQQSDEARKAFSAKGVDPAVGLKQLNDFFDVTMVGIDRRQVWGNGSDFDNVLLRDLYGSVRDAECPWRYHGSRCFRTLKNICKEDYEDISKGITRVTFHNAADDARWQAEVARRLLCKIEAARGVCVKANEFCTDGNLPIDDLAHSLKVYNHG